MPLKLNRKTAPSFIISAKGRANNKATRIDETSKYKV
jgi:hypothetical protein